MRAKPPMQASVKATSLSLATSKGTLRLWAYPFPDERGEPFKLFLNGKSADAARTEGKGRTKPPAIRHYTYIRYKGESMFVKARLEDGSHVEVRET